MGECYYGFSIDNNKGIGGFHICVRLSLITTKGLYGDGDLLTYL